MRISINKAPACHAILINADELKILQKGMALIPSGERIQMEVEILDELDNAIDMIENS